MDLATERSTLMMTLLWIQSEVRSLRDELAAMALAPDESAPFLQVLADLERRSTDLFADIVNDGGPATSTGWASQRDANRSDA
jgi:hypothetical protein